MDAPRRLFRKWFEDLYPGLPNPGRVVRERIIYRSAEGKKKRKPGGFQGDDMDVDLCDFQIDLERQNEREVSIE